MGTINNVPSDFKSLPLTTRNYTQDKVLLTEKMDYLAHDINTTHQYLINVSVLHQLCHIHQCMFKACPHSVKQRWVNM